MPTSDEQRKQDVSRALQDVLNSHGHTFQHAVIRRVHQLVTGKYRSWTFQAIEVPVEVRGVGTRIDFVLERDRSVYGGRETVYYMVAECKRANPAFSNWCFVRAPYATAKSKDGWIILDRARYFGADVIYPEWSEQYVGAEHYPAYHIATELKGKEKGDPNPPKDFARGQGIEDALTQVLRGVNGLIELVQQYPSLFTEKKDTITYLPVIFTTARLWVSDVDLGAGDLLTGNIDLSNSGLTERQWLLFHYNVSPGIKHTLYPASQLAASNGAASDELSSIIEREFIRSVPIVSASGIEDFLTWTNHVDDHS